MARLGNEITPTERGKLATEVMRELHKRYVDKDGKENKINSTQYYLDSFYNEVLVIAEEVRSAI